MDIPKDSRIVRTVKGETVIRYDVNKEHYIAEAQKIIEIIESNTPDKSYLKYMAKLAKKEAELNNQ